VLVDTVQFWFVRIIATLAMFRIIFAGLTAVIAQRHNDYGTCGKDSSNDSDCKNVDFGSCGNACCKIDVIVSNPNWYGVEEVKDKLNQTLAFGTGTRIYQPGGPDGWYELQPTAEGTLGFYDLRQNGSPNGVDFIGQATHTTSGDAHYVDTINYDISTNHDGTYTIRAFSISGIGGALGDNGQNYKNVIYPLNVAGFGFDIKPVDGSCGGAVACSFLPNYETGLCPPALTVMA